MVTILDTPLVQDFVMPFLFVFALTFGLLRITGIFKDNQKVDIIIALIIAAFGVSNSQTIMFIKNIMPFAVVGMIGLFGLVFLWKLGKMMTEGEKMDWSMMAVLLMGVMIALMSPTTWNLIPRNRFVDKADLLFIAGLIVVGALFLFAHRSEGGDGEYKGLGVNQIYGSNLKIKNSIRV